MQIQQNTAVTSFPILFEKREHENSEDAPTDIYQTTYYQGPTVWDDQVDVCTKVAARKRVMERNPCFTDTGQAAYVLADTKRPGLFIGEEAVLEGPVAHACFSTDGQLAYIQEDGLWLARSDGSQSNRVDLSDVTGQPVYDLEFSADGRHLWFCDGSNLFRYELISGRHDLLATRDEVKEFTLSPDGRTVAYLDDYNGLHRVDLDLPPGKQDKLLAEIPSSDYLSDYVNARFPYSPCFTPDGSRVLFTVHTTNWHGDSWDGESSTTASLFAISRSGGDMVEITRDWVDCSRIALPLAA